MSEKTKQPGVCGEPCEVYSRVCGYLRPVQQWNKGKKTEYAQRRAYAQPALDDPRLVAQINAAMQRRFGGF